MATVGVRFRPSERLRYVDDAGHDLKVGDRVTVDMGQGADLAQGDAEAVVALDSSHRGLRRKSTLRLFRALLPAFANRRDQGKGRSEGLIARFSLAGP